MGHAFSGCSSLTAIDLSPLEGAPIENLGHAFSGCSSLTTIDLSPLEGASITNLSSTFYWCSSLHTIICAWQIAPPAIRDSFGSSTISYTGKNTKDEGKNKLIVPLGATGYDSGFWLNPLQNPTKCGFTLKYAYEPTECTSLAITADDASGRATNTTIHWTAITNGIDSLTGETLTGVEITGEATSEEFPQNTSYTDTVERTISYTYMGVTATTTITQGVWIDNNYTLDLNDQWQESTTIANPDSATYDGVYESFSNKGEDNTAAIMYIDIVGYETFKFYVRSYAESSHDYVVVSNLDATLTNSTTSGTAVKLTTSGKQTSGTAISNYQLVEFTGIDGGEHRISVMYRKDSSTASGDDRGYVLIPKEQ